MNRMEHLLTIAVEECCEVGQRLTKAIRFGLDEVQKDQPLTNAQRIQAELLDLIAVLYMIEEESGSIALMSISEVDRERAIRAKRAQVEKYLELSRILGTLDE